MTEVKRRRGQYHVVFKNGVCKHFDSKSDMMKHLAETGTGDVVHIFKGHKLEIKTQTIDRVMVV